MSGADAPKRLSVTLKPISLKREAMWLRITAAEDLKRIQRLKLKNSVELKMPARKISKAKSTQRAEHS